MTGKNCRQFRLLTWTSFIGQFVHSVRGRDRLNVVIGVFVILTSYKFQFIRVHDNLVKDPSNNKSIYLYFYPTLPFPSYAMLLLLPS